jgi:AraC-like DNA-binding protein
VHGDPHTLRDRPDSPIIAIDEAMAIRGGPIFRIAGQGPTSIVVGGWFRFDSVTSQPLTKIIPPLIHISAADAHALGLDTTLQSLANETRGPAPGAAVVVNRLAEVLFIQMIRAYASSSLNSAPGWLGALADRQLGSVLHLMHGKIDQNWTVSELARAVGMSRSAFAQRFRLMVGETPMEYLTNWRLLKARRLLRRRDLKLGQVASSVGYDSSAAFCHAFKRYVGMTPGQYREQLSRAPARRGRG